MLFQDKPKPFESGSCLKAQKPGDSAKASKISILRSELGRVEQLIEILQPWISSLHPDEPHSS